MTDPTEYEQLVETAARALDRAHGAPQEGPARSCCSTYARDVNEVIRLRALRDKAKLTLSARPQLGGTHES
jgi:hypothetical protein